MKRTDLWWLLAWPFYQLVSTARHEVSHAVVAALQGATVTEIRVLPSFRHEGFYWGYVTWSGGHTDWLVAAAPYLCDLALFVVFLPLCLLATRAPRWLWINAWIIGLLSPLIDTAFNYSKLLRGGMGDVGELAGRFPPARIHILFLAVIVFYLVGIWFAWRTYNRAGETRA
jgi:hypothetical protein